MDIKIDITIIIPFYNEQENIPILLQKLDVLISELRGVKAEVIFVDDGSTDASVQLIEKAGRLSFVKKIISLSKNSGSHAAIRAGIFYSVGEYVTIMAADMQDDISLIQNLYKKCLEGYDIAIGQRRSTQEKYLVTLFSKAYSFLMKKFTTPNYPPRGIDVVMFNEKVRKELNRNIESNSNYVLQILFLGFKQAYIEYDKMERKFGKTKWTLSKKIKLLIDSFVAFSYFPIRFVSIMGLVFFCVGSVWTVYIVARTLIYHDLTSGWPALISVLLIGFGITNISSGIIAEYLWRTLDASRKRPVFIIDRIIEFDDNNS